MINIEDQVKILLKYGIEKDEAEIYSLLLKYGVQTPLQISQYTDVSRPSVYRKLNDLIKKGLVEKVIDQNSTKFKPTNPHNLQRIIEEQEISLLNLRENLPKDIKSLLSIKNIQSESTEVRYYSGIEGLKQLLWNITKTKSKKLYGFSYLTWNECVGFKYAEKLRKEIHVNNIKSKEISNTPETEDKWTDQEEVLKNHYSQRYISPQMLEIKQDICIYDNILTFYNIYKKEYFGIEIENAQIAKTQRQLFNLAWKASKPMPLFKRFDISRED